MHASQHWPCTNIFGSLVNRLFWMGGWPAELVFHGLLVVTAFNISAALSKSTPPVHMTVRSGASCGNS